MLRILLIEDDPIKLNSIKEYLLSYSEHISVETKMSYQSGLLTLLKTNFDVILLDMQLPNYDIKSGEDGYKPRPVAGRDILKELKRKKILCNVIIVTQYESFGENGKLESLKVWHNKLLTEFRGIYQTTIQYKPGSDSWKHELNIHINAVLKNDKDFNNR